MEVSDQDKKVMHSLNRFLDSFPYLQLKTHSVALGKIYAITSRPTDKQGKNELDDLMGLGHFLTQWEIVAVLHFRGL